MEENSTLGTAPIGGLLVRLAVPAICAQVVNMLYNIVDRIYIGHIPVVGATALTGVGVGFPIIMLISAFASLIGMGGAPRMSIFMGEHNIEQAERIIGNCFTMLLGISVVLTVGFQLGKEQLLLLFGASAETLPYGLEYLGIYICGTVFVQIALGMNAFVSAQGKAMMGMITVLIGALLNIIFDPILIFGLGMGVRGAAIATVLSQAVSAIWVLCVLANPKMTLRLRRIYFRPRASVLLPVLALGASPFVMQSTESLLSITFNTSLQKFGGDVAVGSMTILSSLMQMITMPLMGLASGAQPVIGYNLGARNASRVRRAVKLLLISAVCYTTLTFAALQLAPSLFASLFTNDATLIAFTTRAIRVYFAASFVMAFQFSLQQSFVAMGEAKISLFLAILRKIILLIPMILILPFFFADKTFAVFIAEPISDFISATVVTILFVKKFSKRMGQLDGTPPIATGKT